MDSSSLQDWLDWQQRLASQEIDLGLERVAAVLARLDLTLPSVVLTVAGTNGKGSTVAFLDAILRETGRSVLTYTSPHLSHYNERVHLNGEPASDASFVAAFRRIESVRDGIPLTYFEFGTLAALCIAADWRPDVLLLEVGLGGRLDAVNVIDSTAALIASVDLDHQEWLGDTRELIGAEKAGVFRAGRPAVYASPDRIPDSVLQTAERLGTDLRIAGEAYRFTVSGDTWSWHGADLDFSDLGLPALRGHHQFSNAAGALALLEAAGLLEADDQPRVSRALQRVRLAGRFESLRNAPEWIVDVAHNPHATRQLADNLRTTPCIGRTIGVVGMLADKDVEGSIRELCDVVDAWFAVPLDSPRAMGAADLARVVANATGEPCEFFDSIRLGVQRVEKFAHPVDRVIAFGSFYLVAPVRELLGAESSGQSQ